MKSIRSKLVLLYLALVFIVMLASGTFMTLSIRMQEIERLETELVAFASMIYGELLDNPARREADYPAELEYLMRTAGNEIEAFILSKDGYNIDHSRGQVIYKSTAITAAMLGQPSFDSGRLGMDIWRGGDGVIAYAMPYPYNPNLSLPVNNIIYVRTSTDAVTNRLTEVTRTIVFSVIAALLLTVVIGFLFASTLTGPIIALTKKAKNISSGAIEVKSKDEIGQLTQTFNEMANDLTLTMESITTEKNKMEILLFNMKDGVLAYDRHGRLIEANYCAEEQLGIKNIKEMSFLEMAAAVDLDIKEFNAQKLKDIKDTAVYVGDKYINMIFSPYYNKYNRIDGIVIVLQDITEHKKLDDLRKEFVANVSHEIRTPLTTIKGYTETLLENPVDKETADKFLTIINKEADRMSLLVHDLLVLSRFDSEQLKLTRAVVDLSEIIETAIGQVAIIAEKKNQWILYEKPNAEYFINADTARINQVFVNILGNAVKYSPEDTKITITIDKTDRFYRVYVKDEGIGIPKDDLLRIFERFYRVDKARSREMGGTGLGLSIAKEIMEAHGFRISASSEKDKGTTMILRFDRYNAERREKK